mgnify:CR=1 FL=1
MHHKKRRLKVMLSEESNKMSKETHSQDSLSNTEWLDKTYNDLVESGNDYGPDVTDMLWTTARKEATKRLHEDLRKDKDKNKSQ